MPLTRLTAALACLCMALKAFADAESGGVIWPLPAGTISTAFNVIAGFCWLYITYTVARYGTEREI